MVRKKPSLNHWSLVQHQDFLPSLSKLTYFGILEKETKTTSWIHITASGNFYNKLHYNCLVCYLLHQSPFLEVGGEKRKSYDLKAFPVIIFLKFSTIFFAPKQMITDAHKSKGPYNVTKYWSQERVGRTVKQIIKLVNFSIMHVGWETI